MTCTRIHIFVRFNCNAINLFYILHDLLCTLWRLKNSGGEQELLVLLRSVHGAHQFLVVSWPLFLFRRHSGH